MRLHRVSALAAISVLAFAACGTTGGSSAPSGAASGGVAIPSVDTSKGTVHMVIGGGGTSSPTNRFLTDPPRCRVITGVAAHRDPATKRRAPTYVTEDAPWSAVRDPAHPYGFAAFDVDPSGGETTAIHATYYAVTGPFGMLVPVDRFTLTRPRRS